ncbi:MAG: LacI family DNA-binding transcriptional regulator [Pseudomonadota bacterium]
MRRRTTGIREIAEAASVSMMTVSRALRGVEGVSETKRSEILRIAQRLNYVANNNARSLAMENSRIVGISLPTFANDVFADVLSGMRGTFEGAGYSSVIDTTEYNPEAEHRWVDQMLTWRPAAVILTGKDHSREVRRKLRASKVPTLEIWDVSEDPIDICVGIDHYNAGQIIGRYAVDLGYHAPGYVGAPLGRDTRADARLRGIREAFAAVPGSRPVRIAGRSEPHAFGAGAAGMEELLRRERTDVVFFLNDHMAFGGMMACQKHGLRIPEDIGIVGFNALDLTAVLPLQMTTAMTPRKRIGVVGARNLLARIHGVESQRAIVLPVHLIEGQTTRPQ